MLIQPHKDRWKSLHRKRKDILKLQALNAELGKGKYKVIELEARQDGSAIQQYLAELTGARTVPRVFIGGE